MEQASFAATPFRNGVVVRREKIDDPLNSRLDLKILLGLSSSRRKDFTMKISFALVTMSTLLFSSLPVRADTIYPMRPCRVYADTSFIQIPDQCGAAGPFYHRRLFLRPARQLSYFYCP
jgi:hypothetical protein